MKTPVKFTSTLALVVSAQLIIVGNAFGSAELRSQTRSFKENSPGSFLVEEINVSSRLEVGLKDSTFQPPVDINGPHRSQGSGTR